MKALTVPNSLRFGETLLSKPATFEMPVTGKVFCHESNFPGNPTHQGFTEVWNHLKSFTEEEVMNFPNRRFSSPSIREYQTSKGDSDPRKKRPEPKPILHEPNVFPQSTSCQNQKHCKDHGLIVSAHHENVLKPRISKRNHIFTWLKNVLFKPFHDLFSLSCALKKIWCRKKHESKLLRPKNHFDLVHDEKFSKLALSHSFPNCFTAFLDFEISKPVFGDQFTCLVFTHVLDDYQKSLDPVFDVLRIEKPFEYFFRRFDVVPLVVLKVQDIKGQFHKEASRGGRHNTCVLVTWNWKYSRKTSKMDLRTNFFEERGNDAPQSMDRTRLDLDNQARLDLDRARLDMDSQARLDLDRARLDLDSRARLDLDRFQNDRDFSLLVRLTRTECSKDRADGLTLMSESLLNSIIQISLRQGSLSSQKTWATLEHNLSDQNVPRPLQNVPRPMLIVPPMTYHLPP
ncbi:LOW QUALITY PROTEIN: hypothetical protein YC2023_098384 [Brassica napus]